MQSRIIPVFMVLTILQVSCGAIADEKTIPSAGDQDIVQILTKVREKHDVPAIAALIVTSKEISAVAVVGVRKRGTDIPVTLEDTWHLGSDTKAMTATLIANLVEQEKLKWETTVAEIFPRLRSKFHQDMKNVTVLQLLSHRSGLPANLELAKYLGSSSQKLRLRAVRTEFAKPPEHQPGSKYLYSNLGYIIAGAIVEKKTRKSWERNMQQHVFGPLKMKHTGFGGMGSPKKIIQPWGHAADGKPVSKNGPLVDNPPVMGPAGRVHCTIQDWSLFVADHLRGARGETSILKKSSYKTLHTPPFGGDYALGWLVAKRAWGGGLVLNHAGSNTMHFANVWVAPKRDFAILVCVNQGGDTAFKATDDTVGALIEYQNKKLNAKTDPDKSRD